jgi:hypothetical protein
MLRELLEAGFLRKLMFRAAWRRIDGKLGMIGWTGPGLIDYNAADENVI